MALLGEWPRWSVSAANNRPALVCGAGFVHFSFFFHFSTDL
jgi:hypothetical protein